MEELKPCPCGGEMRWCKDVETDESHDCDQLSCADCGMQVSYESDDVRLCETFESARAIVAGKWNTRPTDELTRLRAENEALRAEKAELVGYLSRVKKIASFPPVDKAILGVVEEILAKHQTKGVDDANN